MIKILNLSNYQVDCMADICNLYSNLEVVSKNFLHYIEIHPTYIVVFLLLNLHQILNHLFLGCIHSKKHMDNRDHQLLSLIHI